jgi:hypothetical protein
MNNFNFPEGTVADEFTNWVEVPDSFYSQEWFKEYRASSLRLKRQEVQFNSLAKKVENILQKWDYQCKVCYTKFKTSRAYNLHMRKHLDTHPIDYPFTCSVCNTGYRSKTSLDGHWNNARKSGSHRDKRRNK